MTPRFRPLPPVLLALAALAAGDDATEAKFRAYGADCAKVCAPCLDDTLVVPGYDPRFGSSRGVDVADMRRKLTLAYVHHPRGGPAVRGQLEPTKEELRAADALPGLEQGYYGWVASAEVVRVLGPQDMLVTKLRPVGAAEALKRNADILRKAQADLEREKDAAEKALETRIAALEKEKKSLAAWSNYEQSAGRNQGNSRTGSSGSTGSSSSGGSSSGGGAFKAKLEETTRRLRDLQSDKAELSRRFQDDRNEAARLSRERAKELQEAGKELVKIRKELDGTIRLTGFDTAKIRAGGAFEGADGAGFQAAVAWKDAEGRWVLASTDLLKKPLSAAGLRDFLARRKSSVAEFVQVAAEARKNKSGAAADDAMRLAMARWMRPEGEREKPVAAQAKPEGAKAKEAPPADPKPAKRKLDFEDLH